MKPFLPLQRPHPAARHAAVLTLMLAASPLAWAQWTACTSDRAAPPAAVVERFMSADCAACWGQPAPLSPQAPALVLDWIVPTAAADDAPLSAAATRDALHRLQALGRPWPAATDVFTAPVPAHSLGPGARTRAALRLALGPAVNDYVAASVRVRVPHQPATFWLALVESLPPGTEGSTAPRYLVRNTFSRPMEGRHQLSKTKHETLWQQIIPMRIPEGAQPDRLQLMGWIETMPGTVLAATHTVCGS